MIGVYLFWDNQQPHNVLMERCAENWFGRKRVWKVEKTPSGKPFFSANAGEGVSFSDSGRQEAVALADHCIGMDLQKVFDEKAFGRAESGKDPLHGEARRKLRLAERFFHPREVEFVKLGCKDAEILRRFMLVWTCKESFVKYTGEGIDAGFSAFSVIPENLFPKERFQRMFGSGGRTDNAETDEYPVSENEMLVWECGDVWYHVRTVRDICAAGENICTGDAGAEAVPFWEDDLNMQELRKEYLLCVCSGRRDKIVLRRIDAIVTDLDGTVIHNGAPVSEKNKEALTAAIKAGIEVVIATGRPFAALERSVVSVPGIRYAITSNGTAIYDLRSGEMLHEISLTEEMTNDILKTSERFWNNEGVGCEVFMDGVPYACREYWDDPALFGAKASVRSYVQNSRTAVTDIRRFIMKYSGRLTGIDFVIGDPALRTKMIRAFREMDSEVYITSSVKNRIELSHPSAGKHTGMEFLAEKLEIDCSRIMALGDAENDMDMLQTSGIGVAMANGDEKCLRIADVIAPSADRDGVAWAIHTVLGI